MWRIVCLSMLSMSLWTCIWGQEYLPPKAGGKKSGEPSMPAMYDFAYDVNDNTVSLDFGHNEKRKEDKVTGSYHVLLPDGRMQLVEYEAGSDGYKPQVMYMGTATYPSPSADKFDGYHYNAASNRQSVRQPAPRISARNSPTAAPPAPASPPAHSPSSGHPAHSPHPPSPGHPAHSLTPPHSSAGNGTQPQKTT